MNLDFKTFFVYEAMTGETKFDKGDATADHFLVVDFDGSSEFHKVESAQTPYVSEILSKVKPDVKFKSTAVSKKLDGKDTKTGYYRFWSVVGLGYTAAVKNIQKASTDYENGDLLQEGFFNKVKSIFRKFYAFITKVFQQMKQFITSSVQNMQEFLGLEPVVKFNNTVGW